MIIQINEAKNNAVKIKEIISRYSDKHFIDISLRDYVAYQGDIGYAGGYREAIRELAKKACDNKRQEISEIIRQGILEILEKDDCGIIDDWE